MAQACLTLKARVLMWKSTDEPVLSVGELMEEIGGLRYDGQ